MGYTEDILYEIYEDIDKKGLKSQFNTQIEKMLFQHKHKHKTPKEMWEYAHHKVTSSSNPHDNLDH